MGEFTELQRRILETKRDNPGWGPQEVAAAVDCSPEYARDVLDEYDTAELDAAPPAPEIDPSAAPEPDESNSSSEGGGIGTLLVKLLVVWPLQFAFLVSVASIKLAVAAVVLPFKVLAALFGNN